VERDRERRETRDERLLRREGRRRWRKRSQRRTGVRERSEKEGQRKSEREIGRVREKEREKARTATDLGRETAVEASDVRDEENGDGARGRVRQVDDVALAEEKWAGKREVLSCLWFSLSLSLSLLL
jgi:hypothetical protein